ncbi:hypothetical protein AC578_4331 [Pseudocercospora eumusae]|uniref:PWI domain-containing protein n=1 Tax=Pseudocercospora eumusae TaxID=321146 RepID=A0A139H836_9PEZI|nr:hypothetical protein AC578_4331 [Pseudocercospora eumusae]
MSAALKTGADARAMRMTKYPDIFNKKVDMTKVNLPVIKKWVSDEIAKILNSDDDVVTEMIFTIIEGSKSPNIKQLQNDITGFLDKDAAPFCLELWKLCLSAQDSPNGIPKELLEAKKLELIQERIAEDKAREEARQREADERERERELARVRERERGQRGRGGRGGRGRGRDRDRSSDRRPMSRDSRSPPPRRGGRDSRSGIDSYVPGGGRGGRDHHLRRRRSPSYGRSPSRSRSPPRRRRRRNSSSDQSRSRTPPRRRNRSSSNGPARRRSRSPPPRRRRRSPSHSDDSRSPPDRRRRRPSRSRSPPRRRARNDSSRSRSRTPPSKRRSRESGDLMASSKKNEYRLSREGSTYSAASDGKRRASQSSERPASGDTKDERQRMPRHPLRISKEELQKRLDKARREAEARSVQRRDRDFTTKPAT